MRLKLESIELVGSTTVSQPFRPGLSVVTGPIGSGKTSLWKLMRFALGPAKPDYLPPEVESFVHAVGGGLRLSGGSAHVLRPLVSTDTAKVDVLAGSEALLLPARRPEAQDDLTYVAWVMQQLGLPQVMVPRRRRDPESDLEPLSLADFLEWCFLKQDTMEAAIFNATDVFRENKRRYVFEYLYGLSDSNLAALEGELGAALREISALEAREKVVREFLVQAQVSSAAGAARHIAEIDAEKSVTLEGTRAKENVPGVELRQALLALDSGIGESDKTISIESRSIEELSTLGSQLRTQLKRLGRAIVSEAVLINYEFEVCPRCGQHLLDRAEGDCLLCALPMQQATQRPDLLGERTRLLGQLDETVELNRRRREAVVRLQEDQRRLRSERAVLALRLDEEVARYVSDNQARLEQRARRLGELDAERARYAELLRMYSAFDQIGASHAALTERVAALQSQIEARKASGRDVGAIFSELEETLSSVLDRLGVPAFGGTRSVRINRATYEPELEGRGFDTLSSGGLRVVVNIAHAITHHLYAARHQEVPLPRLLVIDSPRKNLGSEGYDVSVGDKLYELLVDLAEDSSNDTQVILFDNGTPEFLRSEYVVRHLSLDDRLVPAAPVSPVASHGST